MQIQKLLLNLWQSARLSILISDKQERLFRKLFIEVMQLSFYIGLVLEYLKGLDILWNNSELYLLSQISIITVKKEDNGFVYN